MVVMCWQIDTIVLDLYLDILYRYTMGNLNVTQDAKEKLEEMAKFENRKVSNMAQHAIHEYYKNEFRGRKIIKDENDRGQ